MNRPVLVIALFTGAFLMVMFTMVKDSADSEEAQRQTQIAAAEQQILTALRSGDHGRVQSARDRLFELFPRSDSEAHSIYENCLQRFNRERSR